MLEKLMENQVSVPMAKYNPILKISVYFQILAELYTCQIGSFLFCHMV